MFKVFVSHSSVDKPFVRRLVCDLSRFGIDSWLDENEIRIGDSIRRSIEAGLGKSDYFLLVISSSSISRPWVAAEIDTAMSMEFSSGRKFILPLRIDSAPIPPLLEGRLYADFHRSYDDALHKLVRAINDIGKSAPGVIEGVETHSLLEIRTCRGDVVSFTKTQTIRCVKGFVDCYVEQSSTTGEFTNLRVFPLGRTRKWEEGGREFLQHWFSPLSSGEQLTRGFRATIRNMFVDAENYWEIRHDYPTRRVVVDVVFPKARPPLSWEVLEKRGTQLIPHSWCQPMTENGKPMLRMVVNNPRQYSSTVLRWQW